MSRLLKWLGFDRPSPQVPEPPAYNFFLSAPKIVHAEYNNGILKVITRDNSGEEKEASYKGSSTVWYQYPMMYRMDSCMERKLSDIHAYIEEHGNPYPTAHETKKA